MFSILHLALVLTGRPANLTVSSMFRAEIAIALEHCYSLTQAAIHSFCVNAKYICGLYVYKFVASLLIID